MNLWDAFLQIGAPSLGNNIDAKAAQLVVQGDAPLTPQQLQETVAMFGKHMQRLRASLVGFFVSRWVLSDGSTVRITSNSGMHALFVQPIAVSQPEILVDWFRAVPTTQGKVNGDDSGAYPSDAWRVPKKLTDGWPSSLKPVSDLPKHPGHVTWCNTDLTYGKHPIIVSWHGPRDRYASTTGFTSQAGGEATAHERNPYSYPDAYPLANYVLTDSQYIWINGRKIDTGVTKVIAVCLYQYDAEAAPGKFVLRVLSDHPPVGTSQRQLCCYDLVPTAGAAGASLKRFAEAKSSLHVKASYPATANTPEANKGGSSSTPGQWDYWQRPHFNKSGTRLATIICKVGTNGSDREAHAVSFDPTTWTVDDDVTAMTSASRTNTWVGSGPWTADGTSSTDYFAAADFEGDAFVYVKLHADLTLKESGVQGNSTSNNQQWAGSKHREEGWAFTLTHSRLGTLRQFSNSSVFDYSCAFSGDTGSLTNIHCTENYTITGASRPVQAGYDAGKRSLFCLIGDLSRATFAVGYWTGGTYSASGDVTGTLNISMSGSFTKPQTVFDVYFNGTQVATAVTGSFDTGAPVSGSGTYVDPAGSLGQVQPSAFIASSLTANTGGGTARYAPAADTGTAMNPPRIEGQATIGTSYRYSPPPVHQNCAVSPDNRAAYMGAAYFESTYATGSPVAGIELCLYEDDAGAAHVQDAPAYFSGTYPTLSVPVFMGAATTGAPK